MKPIIDNKRFEIIKAYCLDPDNSQLSIKDKELLSRWISAYKLLTKHDNLKHVATLLMIKFPSLSRTRAYEDIRRAEILFNSLKDFNYNWWHQWLVNDISNQIVASREEGDLKNWAAGHANLIKTLNKTPEKIIESVKDIHLEIQINNKKERIDPDLMEKVKPVNYKTFIEVLNKDT